MLLGITENLQENNKVEARNKIRIVSTLFLLSLIFPFLIYLLFYFNVLPSKAAFSSDVQEPVAKVITQTGIGTAFLINPTTLLTARHVLENKKIGEEVDLIFEQSKNKYQTKARIKYIAPSQISSDSGLVPLDYFLTDVAVLEVSEISEIVPLYIGESDAVNNLDEVILIGYPNGDYSITKGNINNTKYQGLDLFKLDATSNYGNSGGPCILKDDNTVIGILVGGSAIANQGENIALKINDVKKILRNNSINY